MHNSSQFDNVYLPVAYSSISIFLRKYTTTNNTNKTCAILVFISY